MKKLIFILLLLPITALFAAAKPVIIDTDASTDDAIAILYLLNQKNIDVKAIIVDKNGASSPDVAANHVADILRIANQPQIPVYIGLDKKPKYNNTYPAVARTLVDGSFKAEATPQNIISRAQLINLINQQQTTILSLGSLTNIANILPETKQHINDIVIMGGAVDVPGNLDAFLPDTKNKYAEWNIYVDPDATKTVLSSNISITLVSLDVTNKALLTEKFMRMLRQKDNDPEVKFIYDMLKPSDLYIQAGQYDFWDPLAAYVLVNSAPTINKKINVVTTSGDHLGQLYESTNGYPIKMVNNVDVNQLEEALINGL